MPTTHFAQTSTPSLINYMPIPRGVPRLTLFSGTNCSLCEVAKEELAKVRASRPFHLEEINIHSTSLPPEQQIWKKKYIYWIPALHIEGKEVAKGRWDAGVVVRALEAWEREKGKGKE